jgi:hypothetical protein
MSDDKPAIDAYLDSLFNRLVGTGHAGRRALAEVEDHLRSAAAAAVAAGTPDAQAQVAAVRAFGPPHPVISAARRASRGDWALARVLSDASLLVGLTVTTFSVAFAVRVVDIVVLDRMHPVVLPACGPNLAGICSMTAEAQRSFLVRALVTTGIAAFILGTRWFLQRRQMLPPVGRTGLTATTAVLLGVSVVAYLAPFDAFGLDFGPGLQVGSATAAAGVFMALLSVCYRLAFRERRQRTVKTVA